MPQPWIPRDAEDEEVQLQLAIALSMGGGAAAAHGGSAGGGGSSGGGGGDDGGSRKRRREGDGSGRPPTNIEVIDLDDGNHTVADLDALLTVGTHVRMQHLTNHASLNNRRGVVRRYDVELRRYMVTVRVGDAEVEHAVRAENLVARQ